jgi:hypothetical protein
MVMDDTIALLRNEGMTARLVAGVTGVSVTTARRWMSGKSTMPVALKNAVLVAIWMKENPISRKAKMYDGFGKRVFRAPRYFVGFRKDGGEMLGRSVPIDSPSRASLF